MGVTERRDSKNWGLGRAYVTVKTASNFAQNVTHFGRGGSGLRVRRLVCRTFAGSRVVGDGYLVPRRHGAVLSTCLRTVVFDEQPQSVRCRHLACTSVTCDRPSCSIQRILYTSLIDTGIALNPDDTRRLLLRTFAAQLVAATKICPQPRQKQLQQNAQQTWLQVTQTMMLF